MQFWVTRHSGMYNFLFFFVQQKRNNFIVILKMELPPEPRQGVGSTWEEPDSLSPILLWEIL